jgi:NADH-quinone oxidoreductase subunit L
MFRLFSLTFDGEERYSHDLHPHEAPKVMTVPLMILAVLSVVGGVVGIPPSLGGGNAFEHWLSPVFERANALLPFDHEQGYVTEYIFMILSVSIAGAGIYLARAMYIKQSEGALKFAEKFKGMYTLLWNKYYVDELYDGIIITPVVKGSERLLWKGFDVGIIDGIVNGTAKLIATASSWLRRIQVGVAQSYALVFVVGILVILGILILR